MGMKYRIGYILGDGIGPEIMSVVIRVLNEVLPNAELVEIKAGYEYMKKSGKPLEDGALDLIKSLDSVIKGPLTTLPGPGTFRSINVFLRQKLELYANVRPFRSFKGVSLKDIDLIIIRENTEGLYSGIEGRFRDTAFSVKVATLLGAERIAEFAFKYAVERGLRKVTIVHKANILKESDGLFREVALRVSKKYSGIEIDEMFVDAAAYNLIKNPQKFQVMLTPNLYGDILSDEAAAIVGSLGLCGSAQIGDDAAIFEPIHGSAPDIAGKGIANPSGALMALSLMLEYLGIKRRDNYLIRVSSALYQALKRVIEEGKVLTPDLGGNASTERFGDEVLKVLKELLNA